MKISQPSVLFQLLREIQDRIKRKVKIKSALPWMMPKELDILTEVLYKLQPKFCFEWGSGNSTLYFPTLITSIEKWYSLEHNEDWYKVISQKIADPRISLSFVKAEKDPGRGRYNVNIEGTYEEFKSYVDFPEKLQIKFDFMLIDGRARMSCLRKAYELISDTGVVIVHDANRENYYKDLPPFKQVIRFKDHRKLGGGIMLFSKNRDLNSVLAIESHQSAWKIHDKLAILRSRE